MSLINDVLRDLDARRAEGSPAPGTMDGIEPVIQSRSPARRRALFVSLAVMAAAGGLGTVTLLVPPFAPTPPPVSAAPPIGIEQPEAARAPLGQEDLAVAAEPEPAPVQAAAAREEVPEAAAPVEAAPALVPVPKPRVVRMERTLRPPTPTQQAAALVRHAVSLEQSGDLDGARQELARALAIDPAHQAARLRLATLAFQAGASEEALGLLEKGQGLVRNPQAFVELSARIHLEAGRIGTAIELLESVPATAQGRAMLAALYQRTGRHEQAATLYSEALQQQPENARLWLGLGISLEAQGRAVDARTAYLGAARLPGLDAASRGFARSRIEGLAESVE